MKKPTLDLRPEHLAIVKTILQRHIPGCTVWAFGSRVSGNAKPTSDLDLAIESPGGQLDLAIIGSLADAFDESTLPVKVDVVNLEKASPAFKKIIGKQKVLIQTAAI